MHWVWPTKTHGFTLAWRNVFRTAHSRGMGAAPTLNSRDVASLLQGQLMLMTDWWGTSKTPRGWNLKIPNMETLDNSEEPFRLQSSLRNLAETRCQPYPHLCLTFCPTYHFPHFLTDFSGSIYSVNHSHKNPFLGSASILSDLRDRRKERRLEWQAEKGREEQSVNWDLIERSYQCFAQQMQSRWNILHRTGRMTAGMRDTGKGRHVSGTFDPNLTF